MQKRRLIIIVLLTAIILLIPFVAMHITDEVNWTLFDFILAGAFLLGAAIICEIAIRKIRNIKYRIVACAVLLLFFFVIWAELAVGIFGTCLGGQ